MTDQITLVGFEEPYAKEQTAYDTLLPQLSEAAISYGADPKAITIRHGKSYSSVWFGSLLAFRLCLRKSNYIDVPINSKSLISGIAPETAQKKVTGDFWRVKLGKEPITAYAPVLAEILRATIDQMPKEWDCCSLYQECSDAKQCTHPDKSFALGCGYRKILNSGRIFYGRNRNV